MRAGGCCTRSAPPPPSPSCAWAMKYESTRPSALDTWLACKAPSSMSTTTPPLCGCRARSAVSLPGKSGVRRSRSTRSGAYPRNRRFRVGGDHCSPTIRATAPDQRRGLRPSPSSSSWRAATTSAPLSASPADDSHREGVDCMERDSLGDVSGVDRAERRVLGAGLDDLPTRGRSERLAITTGQWSAFVESGPSTESRRAASSRCPRGARLYNRVYARSITRSLGVCERLTGLPVRGGFAGLCPLSSVGRALPW